VKRALPSAVASYMSAECVLMRQVSTNHRPEIRHTFLLLERRGRSVRSTRRNTVMSNTETVTGAELGVTFNEVRHASVSCNVRES
jgi:hypothetical protein